MKKEIGDRNVKEKFKISNLDLYYSDFHALKNINMEIASNEITAFIGPSGCGKSTFLKSLNRMNDLVEGCRITGEVLLDGENIYDGRKMEFRSGKDLKKYFGLNGHDLNHYIKTGHILLSEWKIISKEQRNNCNLKKRE